MANYKQIRTAQVERWQRDKWGKGPPPDPPQYEGDDPAGCFIDWAEECLLIPSGPLAGKPFRIPKWEGDFIYDIFNPDIQEAGLSVARKNGKSGLIAALALCHMAGPLNRYDWRSAVVSLNGKLAVELREAIVSTQEYSGIVGIRRYKSPLPGRIEGCRKSRMDFLAADRASGHGVGADLAIVDEAGLLEERNRPLWNAMMSCISGRDGTFVAISIQGDGPMFEEIRVRKEDEDVAWHEYSADINDDPMDPATWRKGNPGIADGIKSERYMEKTARRAQTAPQNMPYFMAYDLNMPLSPRKVMICSLQQWKACVVQEYDMPPAEGVCVLGVDLGGSSSMTCAVAFWPETGRMQSWGAFADNPPLHERGLADGVNRRYVRMHENGEIKLYPGRVTPVKEFLTDVLEDLAAMRVRPKYIGCDRYRKAEMLDMMDKMKLNIKVIFRGQGASAKADGSHDVRSWQKWVIGERISHMPSLLVESGISESEIRQDGSGNPALDRARKNGRIDVLQASVIAVGIGDLVKPGKKTNVAVAASSTA